MGNAKICDKCQKVTKYAMDGKVKIYVHPYGDLHYELCSDCTKELRSWLGKDRCVKFTSKSKVIDVELSEEARKELEKKYFGE